MYQFYQFYRKCRNIGVVESSRCYLRWFWQQNERRHEGHHRGPSIRCDDKARSAGAPVASHTTALKHACKHTPCLLTWRRVKEQRLSLPNLPTFMPRTWRTRATVGAAALTTSIQGGGIYQWLTPITVREGDYTIYQTHMAAPYHQHNPCVRLLTGPKDLSNRI